MMSLLCDGLGRRIRFPLKARIAQTLDFDFSLFRVIIHHFPDDARRLVHRRFRLGIVGFEQ